MFRYSLSAQRRLFAVSEPVLLAAKTSFSANERCNEIYLNLTVNSSQCDKRTRVTRNPAPKGATLRHTLSHITSHTVEDILYLLT